MPIQRMSKVDKCFFYPEYVKAEHPVACSFVGGKRSGEKQHMKDSSHSEILY